MLTDIELIRKRVEKNTSKNGGSHTSTVDESLRKWRIEAITLRKRA